MFGSNNTFAKPGGQYTWGVDPSGRAYIYDQTARQMIYYGDQGGAQSKLSALSATGGKTIFEGNRYVAPKQGGTQQAAVVQDEKRDDRSPLVTGSRDLTGNGTGTGATPKVLDEAQLASLDSLMSGYDRTRDISKQKAGIKRDTAKKEKEEEFGREKGKYDGKKLTTLQDFAGAKTDTDLNTRNTLENLLSSLSTMGLGGSRALTRQILDAANMSNRKANSTQAQNNQALDSAFNEFKVGNENDVKKIDDQFDYDVAEADRDYYQNRQNTLYKKADVYNKADRTSEREDFMRQGNDLNSLISNSAFVNPRYNGQARAMATPGLADYSQDIAQYNTEGVGADGVLTPVGGAGDASVPGNLAVRAVAVNGKDLGVKKKTEGDLGYGV